MITHWMVVMITNDDMNRDFSDDNSICIYRDWNREIDRVKTKLEGHVCFFSYYGKPRCPWQIDCEVIPKTFKLNAGSDDIGNQGTSVREHCMGKYLDGYRTNQEIMGNVTALLNGRTIEEYIPAVMVAQQTKVMFDGGVVHGYLPSIGQLMYINKNIDIVNRALYNSNHQNDLFEVTSIHLMETSWWSATEFDGRSIWCMVIGKPCQVDKPQGCRVLPIFSI